MCKIISFFNNKGGVGKTTLVHNLAFALSDKGKRVLCIDSDPEMNLTACMHGLPTGNENSTDKVSLWRENCNKFISLSEHLNVYLRNEKSKKKKYHVQSKKNDMGHVDLISGTISLSTNEGDLYQIIKNRNPYTLGIAKSFQQSLYDNKGNYDFILIDTAPSAGSIVNALMVLSSNYLITPVAPSFFSLLAISNLSYVLENWLDLLTPYETLSGINLDVKFLGIVVQLAKRYKGGGSEYSKTAEEWIKSLNDSVRAFQRFAFDRGRAIDERTFKTIFGEDKLPFIIEKCCDFTATLRGIAEKEVLPVIQLDKKICKIYRVDLEDSDGGYYKTMESVRSSYDNMSARLIDLDLHHDVPVPDIPMPVRT